jgi:hypothetical protein
MDLINRELELFFMRDGETIQEMYDMLMVLVSDIIALGSKDWDDLKVTKKLLRAFAPKDKNLTAIIRSDPRYPTMTSTQLLGEILHQELVDQDVEKSVTLKMGKSLALNASSSEVVELKPKPSKSKKEDTSDEGSTDEETAFATRKYKKFLKSRASRKGEDERKKSQRKCYECGEYGHFIAECPKNKNKNEEEKKYKEKSKEYKNMYQGRAYVGQQWDSSDEDEEPKKQGMATVAMAQGASSLCLFNNFSDDEDHSHFCLMARRRKVQETTTSSYPTSSSSTPSDDIENIEEEKEIEDNMIKKFGKKCHKEIKKLLDKLEKEKEVLHEQEDLPILEEERNLALEKYPAKEKAKVEKLTTDLYLANDSKKRMSKDYTLENESLAFLKATHSELQSSLSCLTENYKTLEGNYDSLWEITKATPSITWDSSASTSKGCSICSNNDINAIKTNHARLEDKIKRKEKEIARLNMSITQGNIGAKSIPKVVDKQGLEHRKNNKANGRVVMKGHEIPLWNKGGYLNSIMDTAHGVTTSSTTKDMPKVVNTTKGSGGVNTPPKASKNVVEHKPSPNYTCDYIVTLDHNGKMVVKYVGAYTMNAMRKSVWVPKVYASNLQGRKSFWVPKPKA